MTILLESSVRVTLIAATIALVLFAMRIKTAAVLHAVWAGVVVLMLMLPVWLAWGPRASLPVLPPDAGRVAPAFVPAIETSAPVAVVAQSAKRAPQPSSWNWALSAYLLGVGVLLLRLVIGTVRASRLKSCVAPITVGFLHPRIILPENAREWPQEQLDVVLAHESEHVRRRDPLFQWLALLNRALFWFHPLAWWLERRLSGLAEEACDAAVIARGYDPREYSEYLLDLARTVRRAGTRVDAVGMAMPGIGLKHRIRQMLSGVPVPKISRPRMACTVAVCAAAAVILAAATLVRAQSKSPKSPGPVFEVASVKPSDPKAGPGGGKQGGGGGPSGGLFQITPGTAMNRRFSYTSNLSDLIVKAYGLKDFLISGGPSWLKKDRFDIQAKSPDDSPDYTPGQFLRGQAPELQLMLQALLAERFNLKLHREQKELPTYELTVLKGGPKFKKVEGSQLVGVFWRLKSTQPNGERTLQLGVGSRSMQEFADTLANVLGRPVLDRTGLKGSFEFTVEYEADADVPGVPPQVDSPAMFTALQEQAGLKLESTRGPVEVLVIDHVEQPSAN